MKKILNRNFLKNYIYIYLLVLFFSFSFFDKNFFINFLTYEKISISSQNKKNIENENYIVILGVSDDKKIYNLNKIFMENKKLKENVNGLNFIRKGQMGYGTDVIYTTNSQNKIILSVKKSFLTKIIFYNIGISPKILVDTKERKKIFDISNSKEGEVIQYFPFKESKELAFYYFIIYLIIAIFTFFLILFITSYFSKKKGV